MNLLKTVTSKKDARTFTAAMSKMTVELLTLLTGHQWYVSLTDDPLSYNVYCAYRATTASEPTHLYLAQL